MYVSIMKSSIFETGGMFFRVYAGGVKCQWEGGGQAYLQGINH